MSVPLPSPLPTALPASMLAGNRAAGVVALALPSFVSCQQATDFIRATGHEIETDPLTPRQVATAIAEAVTLSLSGQEAAAAAVLSGVVIQAATVLVRNSVARILVAIAYLVAKACTPAAVDPPIGGLASSSGIPSPLRVPNPVDAIAACSKCATAATAKIIYEEEI